MKSKNFSHSLFNSYIEVPEKAAIYLLQSEKPDLKLTFRSLFHTSFNFTSALETVSIQPGEVVILILEHGHDLVSAFFGTILGGCIPSIMPFLTEKLSPEKYRQSLASLFEITKPAAVITYPDFVKEVKNACKDTSVRYIINSAQVSGSSIKTDPIPDNIFEALGGFSLSPEDIVLLQHSSGTTGLQKGVALSYEAISNQVESYSKAIELNPSDVIVSWLPLYHDMGLIAGFILPIIQRIPLVLMSPFDWIRAPHRLMKAITHYKGTLCWLPNFAYNFCARKIRPRDLETVNLSSLRAVTNCSEPMYWSSHQMFIERFTPYGLRPEALTTSYAMAENVFAVTQGGIDHPVKIDNIDRHHFQSEQVARPVTSERMGNGVSEAYGKNRELKMLSAGQPIRNTQVQIVNSAGKKLPERYLGEIAIRSNCMLTGYYNRPELTEKAIQNGWYLTGDLGYIADGELYISGRKKDLIIVGGKNIYPQDLENLAGEVPGVHPGRVVAFGVYNDFTGTEDVVIIVEVDLCEQEGGLSGTQIEREKERIAGEIRKKVNRNSDIALRYVQIVERNWLLKTSSGKIARSANKEKYLANQEI